MGWDALDGIHLTREQMEQRRLTAAAELKKGKSPAEVADAYGVSYVSAWRWQQTLNTKGIDGLRKTTAKGAEPKLTAAQQSRLARILEEGPLKHGWATDLWTAPRVREVILREFKVEYHLNHVPKVLYRLGFRPRKPKRKAVEKDEAKKAAWLRGTWVRLKKS